MEFHNFLRSRRSIRRFEPDPIDVGVITRILETAAYAPSAHNRQPWRFAVITKPEQKKHLSEMLSSVFLRDLAADGIGIDEITTRINRSKNRINNSPVIIILCMDFSEMDVYTDSLGNRALAERIMAIQSVAAAGLQLQLAARAEGLDSVWTCSPLFAQDTMSSALDLPANWEPQAMFFLGQSAEQPKEKIMKSLQDIAIFL
jgi:coenzyme F420-0:L-glutamate ligase / coenzyme F420-1:gamma-L-glutamate ligase